MGILNLLMTTEHPSTPFDPSDDFLFQSRWEAMDGQRRAQDMPNRTPDLGPEGSVVKY